MGILTKLTRTGIALSMLISASSAMAEGPPTGCYTRDYSDAHLAKYPKQVVDRMSLLVYEDGNNNVLADMYVTFANQGHVKGTPYAGQTLYQFLLCFDVDGRSGCTVECDGGNFFVTKITDSSMTFKTHFMMIGDSADTCGGPVDLAEEPGVGVSYRLNRVDPGQCPARR